MPVDVKDCWLEKVWIRPFLSELHGKDLKTFIQRCFIQKQQFKDVSNDLISEFLIFVHLALCPLVLHHHPDIGCAAGTSTSPNSEKNTALLSALMDESRIRNLRSYASKHELLSK